MTQPNRLSGRVRVASIGSTSSPQPSRMRSQPRFPRVLGVQRTMQSPSTAVSQNQTREFERLLRNLSDPTAKKADFAGQRVALINLRRHLQGREAALQSDEIDLLIQHMASFIEKLKYENLNAITRHFAMLVKLEIFAQKNAISNQMQALVALRNTLYSQMIDKLSQENPNQINSKDYHDLIWLTQKISRDACHLPQDFRQSVNLTLKHFAKCQVLSSGDDLARILTYFCYFIDNRNSIYQQEFTFYLPNLLTKISLTELTQESHFLISSLNACAKIQAVEKKIHLGNYKEIPLHNALSELVVRILSTENFSQIITKLKSVDLNWLFISMLQFIDDKIRLPKTTNEILKVITLSYAKSLSGVNLKYASGFSRLLTNLLTKQKENFLLHGELETIFCFLSDNIDLMDSDVLNYQIGILGLALEANFIYSAFVHTYLNQLLDKQKSHLDTCKLSSSDTLNAMKGLSKLTSKDIFHNIVYDEKLEVFNKASDNFVQTLQLYFDFYIEKTRPAEVLPLMRAVNKALQSGVLLSHNLQHTIPLLEYKVMEFLNYFSSQEMISLIHHFVDKGDLFLPTSPKNYEMVLLSHPVITERDFEQLYEKDCELLLWALLVIMAKRQESARAEGYPNDFYNAELVEIIENLFEHMVNKFDLLPSSINVAANWLKKGLIDTSRMKHKEVTTISKSHRSIAQRLQDIFPTLLLDMEYSIGQLPSVDIAILNTNILIEVNGNTHYLDDDFTLRKARGILKKAIYERKGYCYNELVVKEKGLYDEAHFACIVKQIKAALPKLHFSPNFS